MKLSSAAMCCSRWEPKWPRCGLARASPSLPTAMSQSIGWKKPRPRRRFGAGYAEVVKYGVLGDEAFFAWLEANHADVFAGGAAREHAIATSCRAKAAIVTRDERETGERALLNFGHTFGHALEAATGFSDRLFHGEGVSVGMVLAAEFSAQLGMISESDAARVRRHLAGVGLPTHLQDIAGFAQEGLADADALMALMAQDKKVKRGRLTIILLEAVGRAAVPVRCVAPRA